MNDTVVTYLDNAGNVRHAHVDSDPYLAVYRMNAIMANALADMNPSPATDD